MTHHSATDVPTTPEHKATRVWVPHAMVNMPFQRLQEKAMRVALIRLGEICTARDYDLSAMLVDLPDIDPAVDPRIGQEDERTKEAMFAPYDKLTDNMLTTAFRLCAAACVLRGLNPETILNL